MPPRPHDNCYWVLPDQFMAGEYPGAERDSVALPRLTRIGECGVRHFIDLTEPHELHPYARLLTTASAGLRQSMSHERWPICDMGVPETMAYANRILDRIDSLIADGASPYVHCWGGVGRTGTIVGCWLVWHGQTGQSALQMLAEHWATVSESKRRRHPESPQTPAQGQFVREWARHDRIRNERGTTE
jgi:hypothetical protein